MMNLQSILDTITLHKDEIHQFGIRQIGIFGSLMTGTNTAESDIDLLLDFEPQKKNIPELL